MTRAAARARTSTQSSLVALFAVYLLLLAWTVLWKLDVPWVGGVTRVVKLVPFVSTTSAGASAPFEVIANFVLFVPFGVYLGLLAPRLPSWKAAAVVAWSSLGLEVTQYLLAIGSSDITDVIVNTAGGVAGLGLLAAARRSLGARTTRVMTSVCTIVTVLALLASALVLASPMGSRPPSDVPGPPVSAAPASGETGDQVGSAGCAAAM